MKTYYWSFTKGTRLWKFTDNVDCLPADASRVGIIEGDHNLKGMISIVKGHPGHKVDFTDLVPSPDGELIELLMINGVTFEEAVKQANGGNDYVTYK